MGFVRQTAFTTTCVCIVENKTGHPQNRSQTSPHRLINRFTGYTKERHWLAHRVTEICTETSTQAHFQVKLIMGISLPNREHHQKVPLGNNGTFTGARLVQKCTGQSLVLPSSTTVVGGTSAAQHEADLNNINHWSAHTLPGISFFFEKFIKAGSHSYILAILIVVS